MANERFCINCHSAFDAAQTVCPFCGCGTTNENPGGALPSGSLLAETYTIGRVKDLDGEGIYYEAFHNQNRMPVIIKEYLPVTLCSKRDADGAIVVREGSEVPYKTTLVDFVDFYKELMRLSGRPGIVRVEDLFKANNTVYVVFEAKKSISLTEWLNRQTEILSFEESLALLNPVLLGLSAMHELGLVHRGVCPENIEVTPDGKTFLVGYATLSLRSINSDLKPLLYDGYSAPEQYSNTEFQGPYTDVYSIAAVLYKMACGSAPKAAAGGAVPTLKQMGADVPGYVVKAIDAAMNPAPRARTQDISTLRLQLENEARPALAGRMSPSAGKQVLNDRTKMILLIAAGVLAAVLVIWLLIKNVLPGKPKDPSSSLPSSVTSSQSAPSSSEAPAEKLPSFVGQKYSDIQANSGYMAKYVFTTAESYSDVYTAGVVMAQTPAAGEDMPANKTVQLTISKGTETVKVPDVLKLTSGDVVAKLREAGITNYNFVTIANDGAQGEGLSVKTDPAAGTTINVKTQTLTVYFAGAAPTPTPTPAPTPTPIPVQEGGGGQEATPTPAP